ncbi:hypothetical protein [Nocardioides sp.]|uniref:hypothetical protein n=1 Tax=Nocardioides sp. TaxID=35761 RepID=UPI0027351BD9|nr:hypothetical protein [Nocardioides sp.]MDP3891454.1 hypothetical protein [Nocardioides sp.]
MNGTEEELIEAALIEAEAGSSGPAPMPDPEAPAMAYEQFGVNFIRQILHEERVLRAIDQVLGESLTLGPMKAGPGRRFATITALATFGATHGHEVEGEEHLTYRVFLPLSVDFELDLNVDLHRFHAEVLVPLTLTVTTEEPLTIRWHIVAPHEDEVTIDVGTDKRRSALLQRVSGLDAELRRFLIKVVSRELEKPHVVRATRIDMLSIIDGAWPQIAAQFLPSGPEDRGQQAPTPPEEPIVDDPLLEEPFLEE